LVLIGEQRIMESNFSDQSRVWIYQSNRTLTEEESEKIQLQLDQFSQQWSSHSRQLKAAGKVIERSFILLMADESLAGASGCSIDSSVHFVKSLQQEFGLDLFDRMNFAFQGENGVEIADRTTFEDLYKSGKINDSTPVFDTLVKTKKDFETVFIKPLSESWHHRFV